MTFKKIRFGSRRLGRRLNKSFGYNRYSKIDWSNPFGGGGWYHKSFIGRDSFGRFKYLRRGRF